MDEQKETQGKDPCDPCASKKQQSKHFLVVYIIGLFSIALVLILLSYLTQVRADRQLQTMNAQLSQQTSAAQGATQKMNVLQDTVSGQEKKLDAQQKLLTSITQSTSGIGLGNPQTQTQDVSAEVQLLRQRYLALDALQQVRRALENGEASQARQIMSGMIDAYGADRLSGTADSSGQPVLTGYNAAEFVEYQNRLGE